MISQVQSCRFSQQLVSILLLLASLLITAPLFAKTINIDGVRLRPSPERTRIVFDLGQPVDHQVFLLQDPDRLVIDIENVTLTARVLDLDLTNSPIREIRSSIRDDNNLRVVLDLHRAVKPRSFILKPIMQYGDRLVIDLYDEANQQQLATEKIESTQPQFRDVVIAIDAGHGGDDPGAIGPGKLYEKDVVLAIAKQLHGLFEQEPGFRAKLIREGDYYVGLRERTAIATKSRADVFLSIHADAFKTAAVAGASVYAISQKGATSEAARRLAEKENRADLLGGAGNVSLDDKDDLLVGVLLDLSMTASLSFSLEMGNAILMALKPVSQLHKKTVEQAAFVVLKSPDIPSLLIETGYISNPEEAKKLGSSSHQKKLAKAIFTGVKTTMQANPPSGSYLARVKEGKRDDIVTYVIVRGDTLSEIASRYQVSFKRLKKLNGLRSDTIRIGQKLKIPPG